MAADEPPQPDVEIVAAVTAAQLRFEAPPDVHVRFFGTGERDSRQVTQRENIETPVRTWKTYRHVSVTTRISSRLVGADQRPRAR